MGKNSEQTTLVPLEVESEDKVFMSNTLVAGGQDISLNSAKTLRVLISKVMKDDLEFKEYAIGVSDLARALKTSKSCISRDSGKIVQELAFHGLCVKFPSGRIDAINWAPTSFYDPETAQFHFKLNERLAPYLFKLKTYFTCYTVDVAIEFGSVYGIRLYELLQKENRGKDFSVKHITNIYLSTLDIRFACGLDKYDSKGNITESRLKQLSHLRQKVIEPAIREIERVFPTLTITYKPDRPGKRTAGFNFIINPLRLEQ